MNQPQVPENSAETGARSELLAQAQLHIEPDPHGPQSRLDGPSHADGLPDSANQGFVTLLNDQVVIKVSGADAVTFLQGQLTNDIARLEPGDSQLSGLCSPKGRLLASFQMVRQEDHFLMLISQNLVESTLKRLRMYVMRAKVAFEEQSDQIAIAACAGPNLRSTLGLEETVTPNKSGRYCSDLVLAQSDVNVADTRWQRVLVLIELSHWAPTWSALSESLPVVASDFWRSTEILAAIARITQLASEKFVPQMINFEITDGVDFNKGCYTGQEVVARSQYLGKQKRRMAIGLVANRPAPGDDILGDDGNALGTVVMSAPSLSGDAGMSLLAFESRQSSDEPVALQIDGQAIQVLPLPYDIPVAQPFKRPH